MHKRSASGRSVCLDDMGNKVLTLCTVGRKGPTTATFPNDSEGIGPHAKRMMLQLPQDISRFHPGRSPSQEISGHTTYNKGKGHGSGRPAPFHVALFRPLNNKVGAQILKRPAHRFFICRRCGIDGDKEGDPDRYAQYIHQGSVVPMTKLQIESRCGMDIRQFTEDLPRMLKLRIQCAAFRTALKARLDLLLLIWAQFFVLIGRKPFSYAVAVHY